MLDPLFSLPLIFLSTMYNARPPLLSSSDLPEHNVQCFLIDDRLYSDILRSLEQTHCTRMWFYMSD